MVEYRLARIDPETATEEQRTVIASLSSGRGRIPTPFNIWLHDPRPAAGMEIIGTHIDQSTVLAEAESEIAILATAVFWKADYVIANHRRHALKAGLPEAAVESILARRRPEGLEGRLGAVSDAVHDILAGASVEDDAFDRYAAEIGRDGIAEVLIVIGYFTSVSLAMTLHALQPKA